MNHADASADSSATMMNAMIRRVRTASLPPELHRPEPVPEAAHRLDVAGLGAVCFDFRPQPLHAGIYQPGVAQVVVLPYQVKQLLPRSEEHTSELQSRPHLVCRLLLEKKKKNNIIFSYKKQTIQKIET